MFPFDDVIMMFGVSENSGCGHSEGGDGQNSNLNKMGAHEKKL